MNRQNLYKHRCIETVSPKDDWLVKVGHKYINLNYLKSEDSWNNNVMDNSQILTGTLEISPLEETERRLFEAIEENPLKLFSYIESESLKTQLLIPRMAVFLSPRTIEKICDIIFSQQNIDKHFVERFYEDFFLLYLKRFYSWSSLHLLIKASEAYPQNFETTLKVLLKDTTLPNNILMDYVENLDEKDCTKLMEFLTKYQMTAEEFDHNLSIIHLIFKKCEKTESIFYYIHLNLEFYSYYCAYNRNYGRLLLCFIENMSGFNVRIDIIKKMVENHCTHFKSPCMDALEKIFKELVALHANINERPRIVIPRPSEDFQL